MRNVVVRVCFEFLAAAILMNGQPGTSRGRDHYCRPPSDSLSMCLANLGSGTPFLSLLELRHIDNHLAYQDANQSAALLFYSRYDLGSLTNGTLRILSNNRLNGPIPASFCDGQSKGLLELRVDNNPDICLCHSTCQIGSKGRKLATFTIVLIAVIVALIILLLLSLLLFFLRRKKSTTNLCLEYLHKGCVPPIIHRDVKTNNILLTHDFEAKVADFGLSKPFLTDAQTHVSTDVVVGTPGYVDPHFGVVLLELVTGRSAVLDQPKRCHLVQWVRSRLAEADITKVADPKLRGRYDNCSILKVIDLAMRCVDISAHQRPTMTEAVMRLKESLQLENNNGSDPNAYMEINDAGNSGMASEAMLARLSL